MGEQLDLLRTALQDRTAWMDGLTEQDLEEMLRGLHVCIDAVQATGSDAPERPAGTS
ncbi:hypothetical protein [Streptomyces sp. GS7]|uniref:hypothetical protein n=1 Tax=Streptomyces sp. GS7 TaxID=2692234 RepID=UPI001F44FFED|nr:hypothetical protein [Streptomyces sp. GS7]